MCCDSGIGHNTPGVHKHKYSEAELYEKVVSDEGNTPRSRNVDQSNKLVY
jgi:hypothetical protein